MKYVIALVLSAFFSLQSIASDKLSSLDLLVNTLEEETKCVKTAVMTSNAGVVVSQFVWNEIKAAESNINAAVSALSDRVGRIETKATRQARALRLLEARVKKLEQASHK